MFETALGFRILKFKAVDVLDSKFHNMLRQVHNLCFVLYAVCFFLVFFFCVKNALWTGSCLLFFRMFDLSDLNQI